MENSTLQEKERTMWLDVAKFMAIIAVMIDYTNGLLYTNQNVAFFSYYGVSLFILVMGITTTWSYSRNRDVILSKIWNKCLGIVRPYLVATIVYGVVIYRAFDLEILISHVIRFNMTGPFYYVSLYLQLILVSPILFQIFDYTTDLKKGLLIEVIGFVIVLWISCWTTNSSNILGVYGGGGKLFGGTYLTILYLGMWFGKYYYKIHFNFIIATILAMFFCGSSIVWWRFIANDTCHIDTMVPYGEGFNPPSISLGLYALLVAATLYFVEMFFRHFQTEIPMKIMSVFAILGKHTLYIFLYHRFFIDYIFPCFFAMAGIAIDNIWVKRVVYFVGMILGSLLFEFALEKIHRMILVAYKVKH